MLIWPQLIFCSSHSC